MKSHESIKSLINQNLFVFLFLRLFFLLFYKHKLHLKHQKGNIKEKSSYHILNRFNSHFNNDINIVINQNALIVLKANCTHHNKSQKV